MKFRNRLIIIVSLSVALCLSLTGCAALIHLFGGRAIEPINPTEIYVDEVNIQLGYWAEVVDYWEEHANNPGGELSLEVCAMNCHDFMEGIIADWDEIEPPGDTMKEYHQWMRLAMSYEMQAYEIMSQSYSLNESSDPQDFNDLHNLVVQLWVLKDKALFKAQETLKTDE